MGDDIQEHEPAEKDSMASPWRQDQPELEDGRGLDHIPSRSQGSAAYWHSLSSGAKGTVEDEDDEWNLDRTLPASSHHAQGVRSDPLFDPYGLNVPSPSRLSWAWFPL